jgi:hypothetical protein
MLELILVTEAGTPTGADLNEADAQVLTQLVTLYMTTHFQMHVFSCCIIVPISSSCSTLPLQDSFAATKGIQLV